MVIEEAAYAKVIPTEDRLEGRNGATVLVRLKLSIFPSIQV
jgi:hypothetical protein